MTVLLGCFTSNDAFAFQPMDATCSCSSHNMIRVSPAISNNSTFLLLKGFLNVIPEFKPFVTTHNGMYFIQPKYGYFYIFIAQKRNRIGCDQIFVNYLHS